MNISKMRPRIKKVTDTKKLHLRVGNSAVGSNPGIEEP